MSSAWQTPPPEREALEAWLDDVRPGLVADGGNVELIAVDPDGTVRLEMQGSCAICPAQHATLRVALESPMKEAFPGVQSVMAV